MDISSAKPKEFPEDSSKSHDDGATEKHNEVVQKDEVVKGNEVDQEHTEVKEPEKDVKTADDDDGDDDGEEDDKENGDKGSDKEGGDGEAGDVEEDDDDDTIVVHLQPAREAYVRRFQEARRMEREARAAQGERPNRNRVFTTARQPPASKE